MPEGSNLSEYLKLNQLKAAFSNKFQDLLHTKQAYRQAQEAYELGGKLHPVDSIYLYSRYLCHHIGNLLAKNEAITSFCYPKVLEIYQ